MSGHATDIWGQPWKPCEGCPHPTPGACPSRRHRAFCDHLARDPERWAPLIAEQQIEDRPGRDTGFRAIDPPGPTSSPGSESDHVVHLVMACDYRAKLSGDLATCGCAGRRFACLAGRGDRVPGMEVRSITLGDCLACVGA